jgi:hypothetical protein
MATYVYVSQTAGTVYSGELCIPVGAGDTVELSDEDIEPNQHYFDDGSLVEGTPEEPAKETPSKSTAKK